MENVSLLLKLNYSMSFKGINQEQLNEINEAIEGFKKSGLKSPSPELEEKKKGPKKIEKS